MTRWNPNAATLARLRAQVLHLWGRHCDWCGPVAPPAGYAHCVLCHQLIDLALPSTHPFGYSLHHLHARARNRHRTQAEDRDPRGLRPAHLQCNQRAQDDPAPARPAWTHPALERAASAVRPAQDHHRHEGDSQ